MTRISRLRDSGVFIQLEQMIDESTVRNKVREAIQMGKLPHRLPDRTHGGRGTEVACASCGDLVRRDQMEIRMELVGYASPYQKSLISGIRAALGDEGSEPIQRAHSVLHRLGVRTCRRGPPATSLIGTPPNSWRPPAEELYLLHGELMIDDKELHPGDYNRAEAGSADQRVWSETGCTCVLLTSTRTRTSLSLFAVSNLGRAL